MTNIKGNKRKRALVSAFLILLILVTAPFSYAAKKEKFDSWQAVAIRMAEVFDEAIEFTKNDEMKEAYERINKAYFGYYEIQGFEKNVMVYISAERVNHVEALFGNIKHSLLGNEEAHKDQIIEKIETLKVKVYRDAMILDGVLGKSAPDYEGERVYGDGEVPNRYIDEVEAAALKERGDDVSVSETTAEKKSSDGSPEIIQVDQSKKDWGTFVTTFGLLLREGLEAILVVVAIIAYLIKTGNKHMCKSVYIGVLAAVICSILLAVAIEVILGGSGVAQEMIEGWTMFIAVAVLFYVSNWMLSKADNEKWENYIQGKVSESIDSKSQKTLVFAAFLAVLREGAELILFYKASFSSGLNSPAYIIYGLLAGIAVLAIVYVVFRYTTVKLPLKPFFVFTSILLYLMCISFMGKGVIELTEANVISGRTTIPALKGLNIDILNIQARAETLIPQLMLVIASAWMLLKHTVFSGSKKAKEVEKDA